jgi:hypothetical protein
MCMLLEFEGSNKYLPQLLNCRRENQPPGLETLSCNLPTKIGRIPPTHRIVSNYRTHPQPLHVTQTSTGVHAWIFERGGREHMDCISGIHRDCVLHVAEKYCWNQCGTAVGTVCYGGGGRRVRIEWRFPNSSPLSHGNLCAVPEVTSEGNVLTKEPVMTTSQFLQHQVRLHSTWNWDPTSQETHYVYITKINRLTPFREMISARSENHINALSGQSYEFLNMSTG